MHSLTFCLLKKLSYFSWLWKGKSNWTNLHAVTRAKRCTQVWGSPDPRRPVHTPEAGGGMSSEAGRVHCAHCSTCSSQHMAWHTHSKPTARVLLKACRDKPVSYSTTTWYEIIHSSLQTFFALDSLPNYPSVAGVLTCSFNFPLHYGSKRKVKNGRASGWITFTDVWFILIMFWNKSSFNN